MHGKTAIFLFRYTEIFSSILNTLWEFLTGHSGISPDFLVDKTLALSAGSKIVINLILQLSAGEVG